MKLKENLAIAAVIFSACAVEAEDAAITVGKSIYNGKIAESW